jgi:hypothetical protein
MTRSTVSWLPARRRRLLLSAVAVASLVAVGLVPSPSQAQTTVCTGSITNIITPGDIEVPDGESCVLTNVLVTGDADVGAGADLFLIESTVAGALVVNGSAFAQVTRSTVSSGISLLDAFGLLAEGSTLTAGVDVDGGLFFSTATTISGNVISTGGWTLVETAQVAGNVSTAYDQATDLFDTTVAGNVTIHFAATGSVICRSTFSGSIAVTSSNGVIQIGGDQPTPLCGSNVFTGSMSVDNNNASDIQVAGNLILGDLACGNNTPAPAGSGNLVFGTAHGQCSNLGTISFTEEPLAVAASQANRRQAILAVLDDRADLG